MLTDWGAHLDRGPLGVLKLALQLLHSLESIQLHTALLSKPASHLRREGRHAMGLALAPWVLRCLLRESTHPRLPRSEQSSESWRG